MSTRAALNSQTLEEFVQRAARASPPSSSTTKTPEDTILREEEEGDHGSLGRRQSGVVETAETNVDSPVQGEN